MGRTSGFASSFLCLFYAYKAFFAGFACLLGMLISSAVWAVPAGTVISNTANLSYQLGVTTQNINSNPVLITTVAGGGPPTPARLSLRRYAASGVGTDVRSTAYDDGSGFVALPPPTPFGAGGPVDLNNPVGLQASSVYHTGDPIFIELEDADQNTDNALVETIDAVVTVLDNGDAEVLRLTETGPDTGIFSGYVTTVPGPPVSSDGDLSVASGYQIQVRYVDPDDGTDIVADVALIDPAGIVFDTRNGQPVDGATVRLLDAVTGLPATVFGDDGTSSFPATVVSGGTATDSSSNVYNFAAGEYRFPLVAPGDYRIEVTPPAGYTFPTVLSDGQVQALPGSPFALVTGSRGETFTVAGGPVIYIDLPIDAGGSAPFLSKTSNKSLLGIGDFVEWQLAFNNGDNDLAAENVRIEDTLPQGFRYRKGSTRINGQVVADPVVAGNGRDLVFTVGDVAPRSTVDIRYVTEVVPGAVFGQATNVATAVGDYGLRTNRADASVIIRDELFRSEAFLIGRVVQNSCDAKAGQGVEGARIYLENGTYVVTDADGLWHIEGVKPGTHVVQLDKVSLPDGYEVVACEKDTRHAQRSYSQFVDVRGGSLHRADFFVRQQGLEVTQSLNAKTTERGAEYTWELRGNESASNLRAMVAIPEGWYYIPGSTDIDGVPAEDPTVTGNTLIYRLGDARGPWLRRITLRSARGTELKGAQELRTMAIANLGGKNNQRLEPLALNVADVDAPEPIQHRQVLNRSEQGARAAKEPVVYDEHVLFDDKWLASANADFEWVYPTPGANPAIPALRIGIKHPAKYKVRLLVNGQPVSPLNFDGASTNPGNTVAMSRWRGVDVEIGDNRFEAILLGPNGNEVSRIERSVHYSDAPYRAELIEDQSILNADGRANPVLAVRFTDRFGYPARPGVLGRYDVNAPFEAAETASDVRKGRVLRANQKPQYLIGENGIAYIELQPTTQTGEALVTVYLDEQRTEELRAWLKPTPREWIMVGLAEGTLGERMASGDVVGAARADLEDGGYSDGRAAFFAKGQIKGEWILTAAYDSDKDTGDRFKQVIDPDTYYTLYGDDTQQGYEAASSRKLYLKLERERFYAMFGDYDTGLTVTELSRYSRSFTGFKSEYQGEKWKYNLFAAETEQQYIRDELRGDGTSGLYALSNGNILENSEKITIEVRDRFRSEIIVSSQSMSRHLDYNIDYDKGAVYFREPILSKDQQLNPVYIVIEYETREKRDGHYTAGGRVAMSLGGDSEIGISAIHEGGDAKEADLVGADLTLELTEALTLNVEAATTDASDPVEDRKGEAYVVELIHDGEKLDGTLYFRQQDETFGLGQQATSEAGTKKYGADLRYDIEQDVSLNGEVYRQENLTDKASRDVADLTLEQRGNRGSAYVGTRYARDKHVDDQRFESTQMLLGGSRDVLDKKVTLRADAEILVDQDGEAENPDYPNRLLLGADYHVTETLDLLLTQEFTWGDLQDTQSTIVGARTRPWTGAQVLTSVGRETGEYGDRVFSNMGLLQNIVLDEHWTADLTFDRTQTLSDTGQGNPSFDPAVPAASGRSASGEDFTAVSTALGYNTGDREWAGRVEYRESDTDDKWNFFTGYIRELSEGLAMSVGAAYTDTRGEAGLRTISSDVRYSVAWRPLDSAWSLFNRLDYLFDRTDDTFGSTRSRRLVNNLLANYKPDWRSQWNFQYSAKWVLDNIGGEEYDGYTDLYGAEYRYNLSERWDLGVHGSTLNNWDAGIHEYSYGLSVGASPYTNTWVSVGYNFDGFRDDDFSGSEYTAKGFYLKFRLKFDQETIRDMWKENGLR